MCVGTSAVEENNVDSRVETGLRKDQGSARKAREPNSTKANKAKGTDGRGQATGTTQPKAKLCKFFLRGHCFRGEECPFTHGRKEDLRQQQNVYRTQMCTQFVKDRSCRHGTNCMYAHSQEELQTPPCSTRDEIPKQEALPAASARAAMPSSPSAESDKAQRLRIAGLSRCNKINWADCDDSDTTEDAWSSQADHQSSRSGASTPCQRRQKSDGSTTSSTAATMPTTAALAAAAEVGVKSLTTRGPGRQESMTRGAGSSLRRLPTSMSWPGALAEQGGCDDSEFELVVKNSFLSFVPSNAEKSCVAAPPRQRAKSASPVLLRN